MKGIILFISLLAIAVSDVTETSTNEIGECMKEVDDVSALFPLSDIITPPLAGVAAETNETCTQTCCQTDHCNVVIFQQRGAISQSMNSTSINCVMFACHPTTTCSFNLGEGDHVFINNQDAMPSNTNDTPSSPTPPPATSSTTTTEAVDGAMLTTTTAGKTPSNLTDEATKGKSNDNNQNPVFTITTTTEDVNTTNVPNVTTSGLQHVGTTTVTMTTPGAVIDNNTESNNSSTTSHNETTSPLPESTMGSNAVNTTLPADLSQSANVSTPPKILTTSAYSEPTLAYPTLKSTTEPSTTTMDTNTTRSAHNTSTVIPSVSNNSSGSEPEQNNSSTVQPPPSNATTDSSHGEHMGNTTSTTTTPATPYATQESQIKPPTNSYFSTTGSSNASNQIPPITDSTENDGAQTPATTTEKLSNSDELVTMDPSKNAAAAENNSKDEINYNLAGNLTDPPPSSSSSSSLSSNATSLGTSEESPNSDEVMDILLICAAAFGCIFTLASVGVLGKRIYDGYRKRHYSRLDYLINGMYN